MQGSKTQAKRDRINRGSKRGATLAERADGVAAIQETRTTLATSSHRDTGANTGEEMQARSEVKRSMAAETYTPPIDPLEPTRELPPGPPRVKVTMLLEDLRRAVKVYTRGYGQDERSDLATDALLIIAEWTSQGTDPHEVTDPKTGETKIVGKGMIPLGDRGQLPTRAAWFDPDTRTVIRDGKATRPAPSAQAYRAMRAAILQAAAKRESDSALALTRAMEREANLSTDDESIGTQTTLARAALDRDESRAEFAPSVPDAEWPEALAEILGCTLSCARTIIARAWTVVNLAETDPATRKLQAARAANLWQVTPQRAANILSEGKREIHKRWPDPGELVDALRQAAPEYREALVTRAWLALTAVRDCPSWGDSARLTAAAETAIAEWRAAVGDLPMETRAIELAAARIGWRPDRITATGYVVRLLAAETRRGQRSTAGQSHLPGAPAAASANHLRVGTVPASVERWRRIHRASASSRIIGQTTWARYADGYSGACSIHAQIARYAREHPTAPGAANYGPSTR